MTLSVQQNAVISKSYEERPKLPRQNVGCTKEPFVTACYCNLALRAKIIAMLRSVDVSRLQWLRILRLSTDPDELLPDHYHNGRALEITRSLEKSNEKVDPRCVPEPRARCPQSFSIASRKETEVSRYLHVRRPGNNSFEKMV